MTVYPQLSDFGKWIDLPALGSSRTDPFFEQIADLMEWPEKIRVREGSPQQVLRALGVEVGDYVILPNLSPAYWAEAVHSVGAACILIDVHPDTWQLDLDLVEEFLMNFSMLNEKDELILKKDSGRIGAVLVPHLLGNLVDMERLQFIARRFHLQWGEDISQALGSRWKGRPAGSFAGISYCDFARNPLFPFGQSVLIAQDSNFPDELPENRISPSLPMSQLANRAGHLLLPEFSRIIHTTQELEQVYRREINNDRIQWMTVPAECLTNGLSAAFLPQKDLDLEAGAVPMGRLSLPLYRIPPFNTSLYIRREDWSAKIYEQTRILPTGQHIAGEVKELVKRISAGI